MLNDFDLVLREQVIFRFQNDYLVIIFYCVHPDVVQNRRLNRLLIPRFGVQILNTMTVRNFPPGVLSAKSTVHRPAFTEFMALFLKSAIFIKLIVIESW